MANVNKVILVGNVTRDPEIKYTPKGTAVAELGLAVNRFIPEGDGGEKREEVTFIDITLWGRQAEIANEYARKGRAIYIEGRLQLDTWEDKVTGQKRSKLKVVGENLQLLGEKTEERQQRQPERRPPPRSSYSRHSEPEDDDIPF